MLVLQIAVGIVLAVLILRWLPQLIGISFVLLCVVLVLSAYAAVVAIVWSMTGNFALAFWLTFGLVIGGEKLIKWYRKRRPRIRQTKEHGLGFDERRDSDFDDGLGAPPQRRSMAVALAELYGYRYRDPRGGIE